MLLGIFSALASAGGIGGSEIAIPLIEIFYGFEHSDTKPLAQVCIFVTCFTWFLLWFNERHPLKPRATEIDYTVAMIL